MPYELLDVSISESWNATRSRKGLIGIMLALSLEGVANGNPSCVLGKDDLVSANTGFMHADDLTSLRGCQLNGFYFIDHVDVSRMLRKRAV